MAITAAGILAVTALAGVGQNLVTSFQQKQLKRVINAINNRSLEVNDAINQVSKILNLKQQELGRARAGLHSYLSRFSRGKIINRVKELEEQERNLIKEENSLKDDLIQIEKERPLQ